jgi:hypothetical protein
MRARILASVSPLQSPNSAILALISFEVAVPEILPRPEPVTPAAMPAHCHATDRIAHLHDVPPCRSLGSRIRNILLFVLTPP